MVWFARFAVLLTLLQGCTALMVAGPRKKHANHTGNHITTSPTICKVGVPQVPIGLNDLTEAQDFLDSAMASTDYGAGVDKDVRRASDRLGPRRKSICQEDTYGELSPAGAQTLFHHPTIKLGPQDVFYDLGSGLARLVAEAAVIGGAKKAVGVELSESRHDFACKGIRNVAEAIRSSAPSASVGKQLEVRCGDVTAADVHDATVVYVANLCYREELTARIGDRLASNLPHGARVAALREFPPTVSTPRRLILRDKIKVQMTWGQQFVYIYRVD